jgi:hypothetical protein
VKGNAGASFLYGCSCRAEDARTIGFSVHNTFTDPHRIVFPGGDCFTEQFPAAGNSEVLFCTCTTGADSVQCLFYRSGAMPGPKFTVRPKSGGSSETVLHSNKFSRLFWKIRRYPK